jgi:hypothetical protein
MKRLKVIEILKISYHVEQEIQLFGLMCVFSEEALALLKSVFKLVWWITREQESKVLQITLTEFRMAMGKKFHKVQNICNVF